MSEHNVDAVTIGKLASQIAAYLSHQELEKLATLDKVTLSLDEGPEVKVTFTKGSFKELTNKYKQLKQIDPIEDVLIQVGQFQIRVLGENMSRGGYVMTFKVDSPTTVSLVGKPVPLNKAQEFLFAKTTAFQGSFLYIKEIPGRFTVNEIYLNGRLISRLCRTKKAKDEKDKNEYEVCLNDEWSSLDALKAKIKELPSEQHIFLVFFQKMYADYRDLLRDIGLLDENFVPNKNLYLVEDGDIIKASANAGQLARTCLEEVDWEQGKKRLNIDMVLEKGPLAHAQENGFDELGKYLEENGILSITLAEFSQTDATSRHIGILVSENEGFDKSLQEAINKHSESEGKALLAGKILLMGKCGNPKAIRSTTEIVLNNGSYGIISFNRPLNHKNAILLIRELVSNRNKYIGKTLQEAIWTAIGEIERKAFKAFEEISIAKRLIDDPEIIEILNMLPDGRADENTLREVLKKLGELKAKCP
ncbi:MAG: hypothetical protein BWK78_03980 [Thiotrichaceae bacterium IS1]|nr:MAG: hypothetical protein BWK78_03980 [Thiotrichaceae bacterium IS1]